MTFVDISKYILFEAQNNRQILNLSSHLFFTDGNDMEYYTHPNFPNSVWVATSVVLAILGAFGIASNLTIVMAYLKNDSVR